jgi:hypothetical protein
MDLEVVGQFQSFAGKNIGVKIPDELPQEGATVGEAITFISLMTRTFLLFGKHS